MNRKLAKVLASALIVTLCACGGGGSSDSPPVTPPTTPPVTPTATAPSITTQPANASVTVGQTATFTVVATGTDPLSYQWQKGGATISGATSASYTTPATATGDDGAMFAVVVTNGEGSVTSTSAKLSVAAAPVTPPPSSTVDVVTFKNDVARTGQNLGETTLTTANVTSATFGLINRITVDGKIDAQPLYLSKLTVGSAMHNVVFVATEHGSVYAFDADAGTKLWQVSLLATGEMPSGNQGCPQVVPEIGITSTPVIDRTAGAHGTIYVVAMSLDTASNYHQRLHALDVTTGAELLGGPTDISATFPNTAGTSTFSPGMYEERAALLLANGLVYTSWTSHCDNAPYQGWIISFNQATLARSGALNVAPNASGSGFANQGPAIWMSGDGPGADTAGNVYLLTGNGRFETTLNGSGFPNQGDYGNSFLKISNSTTAPAVADYFTMSNEVTESTNDQDLGSGGEMLLPDLKDSTNTVKHLVVGAGKDGNIYVVNRDGMGKFNSSSNNIWQEVSGALGGGVFSSPAYFNGTLYYGAVQTTLKAFSITNAMIAATPASHTSTSFAYPGASPVVSANGATNGIVWAHEMGSGNVAVLHAYDATNLATELYNSNQASGSRDQFGTGNKYIVPTVAGGKVFVGTTNQLAIFGLMH